MTKQPTNDASTPHRALASQVAPDHTYESKHPEPWIKAYFQNLAQHSDRARAALACGQGLPAVVRQRRTDPAFAEEESILLEAFADLLESEAFRRVLYDPNDPHPKRPFCSERLLLRLLQIFHPKFADLKLYGGDSADRTRSTSTSSSRRSPGETEESFRNRSERRAFFEWERQQSIALALDLIHATAESPLGEHNPFHASPTPKAPESPASAGRIEDGAGANGAERHRRPQVARRETPEGVGNVGGANVPPRMSAAPAEANPLPSSPISAAATTPSRVPAATSVTPTAARRPSQPAPAAPQHTVAEVCHPGHASSHATLPAEFTHSPGSKPPATASSATTGPVTSSDSARITEAPSTLPTQSPVAARRPTPKPICNFLGAAPTAPKFLSTSIAGGLPNFIPLETPFSADDDKPP